ncbi:thioredoxin family protein [Parasediminibacterium sp. JCM 36343]|uniref:thioredoxin family protein n=1 Tax=Parasediminibacterium sp. JCM 36343 TaxID=3374279 RepID=UPI003977E9F6
MKTTLLFIFSLFLTFCSYAQGIEFEHGTWAEVLAKAKQTEKPIFVDVYTSWCGPCKRMAKDVFPMAEVGKAYNANFICYTVDAEKGEGMKIASQYEVNSYPTYLFLKADQSLIMKSMGSMASEKFIALTEYVKAELATTKPLQVWDKEYAQKKIDSTFLLAYIQERSKLGISNAALFDEYLALLPADSRASKAISEIYKKERNNLKINSLAYENFQTNPLIGYNRLVLGYGIVSAAINNSFREAVKTKNEQLLQQVIDENGKLPKTQASKQKEEFYMDYYEGTNNMEKYISSATMYCETYLMPISTDSIAKQDKINLQKFEATQKPFLAMMKDTALVAELRDYNEHLLRNKNSNALNEAAWGFFEKVTDTKALEDALRWSKRSLDIYLTAQYIDTYANLLYKLGRKQEAITKETEALNFAKSTKGLTKVYEDALKKMNAGEKTWK